MSVLDNLQARIDAMMSSIYTSTGQLVPRQMYTPADVRLYITEITQVEKNLRLLKTEINNESKQVSMHFSNQMAKVSPNPIAGAILGRKNASHLSAMERQRLHHNKNNFLEPYHQATMHIERYISMLEDLKISMKRQII